jgi:hypothetical protein
MSKNVMYQRRIQEGCSTFNLSSPCSFQLSHLFQSPSDSCWCLVMVYSRMIPRQSHTQ